MQREGKDWAHIMTNESVKVYKVFPKQEGSSRYGLCEICGQEVDLMFHQVEETQSSGIQGGGWRGILIA